MKQTNQVMKTVVAGIIQENPVVSYVVDKDAILNGYLYKASWGYDSGEYNSEDAAIQYIKEQVAQSFPSLITD